MYIAGFLEVNNNYLVHLYVDDTQMYLSFKPDHVNAPVYKINRDIRLILTFYFNFYLYPYSLSSYFSVTSVRNFGIITDSPRCVLAPFTLIKNFR